MLAKPEILKQLAPLQIIQTSDGSNSLLNTELNETYHSVHGAIRESKHVFIQHGLEYYFTHYTKEVVNVLEVGFGTGLNTVLALQTAIQHARNVHYTTLESFVLSESVWRSLNYADELKANEAFDNIHHARWGGDAVIDKMFTLEKLETTIQQVILPEASYDVIFFDAFAPNKQPEMWEPSVLKTVFDWMSPGAVFVTYCAKGQLKRDLKQIGFVVETIPGPPGKKEMVRALKSR